MENDSLRDLVTIEDEKGQQISYEVEALFEMQGESYALLRNQNDTVLMKVEEDEKGQHLVPIAN
ncbi:DUF1292 domain-containing protein [Niallia endozanthoxylica]|uniref:DUF1292 domain-containing protein n=1 Tax=Niallia endozanthoxylica TaxID=2036016 RepID=A0A5J5HR28_9BACI|nr:DUF1292 domain-containing protein [Niallia endozanthoxylica]KAA9023641.1 DUF1292 domain-containing protein [Niallia endozanthoxylica]